VTVRRLGPQDAPAFHALRREALEAHPLAFGSSPDDDRFRALEEATEALKPADDRAVHGAFGDDGALIGMGGVRRDARIKSRHIAFIWGMYVAPAGRGHGAGGRLLEALIAQARIWPGVVMIEISVTEAAAPALRLYETAGFRAWGTEPRSLCWEGRYVDQVFMTMDLDRERG
jgi:RimJ/RimL family protein N-acetyltransferase